MKSSFGPEHLALFSDIHGRELAELVANTDAAVFKQRVPPTWLELVARPDGNGVRAIWEPAASQLPRFVSYLAGSVQGAAMIEVHGLPVLLLALPDWRASTFDLSPGFCWMGVPTRDECLEQAVAEFGPIPASLEQLWRVTNFITLKDRSMLCSLHPESHPMAERPVVLPALPDTNVPEDVNECLQIAVVNDQMVTCMTRHPGQQPWNDILVLRFRRTHELSSAVRIHLDDKLADWTFVDWSPADATTSDLPVSR